MHKDTLSLTKDLVFLTNVLSQTFQNLMAEYFGDLFFKQGFIANNSFCMDF
jgi:hypothetical protein